MTEIIAKSKMIYTLDGLFREDIRLIHWCLETSDRAINPELKVRRQIIMDAIDKLTENEG